MKKEPQIYCPKCAYRPRAQWYHYPEGEPGTEEERRVERTGVLMEPARLKKTRLAVLAAALACGLAFAQDKRDENEVVFASKADPDMVAAIEHARETLDDFLAIAANPTPDASAFKLKVMIKSGADTEHFWVTPFRREGAEFVGVLANEPRVVKTVKAGEIVRFSRDQISDWGYVKSGRQVGSFTVCALFKKMPRDQAEYYRKAHGFDC